MDKIVTAKASFVMTSPRKLRLVVDAVRGLPPRGAIEQLKVLNKRAAGIVLQVYQQAMGNAKNNFKMSPDGLRVRSIQVHEGPRFKRRDKSHGARFDSGVRKRRMAHVTLELEKRI